LMDRWLDNITADHGSGTQAQKVVRDKPAGLVDACWTTAGEEITGVAVYEDGGPCRVAYPTHGDPRIAAGAPLAGDVLRCALKPIAPEDFSRLLSSDQLERLKVVFPSGVCDYTQKGIGQERPLRGS
jgi:hypothetical protein